MQLTFLGKSSDNGESPTLYATDEGSYIIQGYVVTDDEVLAKCDIPDGEIVIEVYARLLAHLAHDGVTGAVTNWRPPIMQVLENGNYIIQGPRLADDETRQRMAIPAYEEAVLVPKADIHALVGARTCS